MEVAEVGFVPQLIRRSGDERCAEDFVMLVGAVRSGEIADEAVLAGDLARDAYSQLALDQRHVHASADLVIAVIAHGTINETRYVGGAGNARSEDHRTTG